MKISLLLPDLKGGGAEKVNLSLAHEFKREGHEVEFVLMSMEGELLSEVQSTYEVIDLGGVRARKLPLALARYIRKHQPDALLANMWPLTIIAPLAQRLSGHRCKVLVIEHGTISVQYRDWGRVHNMSLKLSTFLGYRLADGRIGVSKGVADDMAKLSKLRQEEFHPVYNPVPPYSEPSPDELEAANQLWQIASGSRILAVGNIKAVKNHPLLLRAFAAVAKQDARLMILGGGDDAALKKLAIKLEIAERVIFAGFHSDISPFYASADLFVLSSQSEGFGNVIVEALAFGLPVVSTDCPSGPSEILEQGKYGQLVPMGDEEALTKAMERALDAPVDKDALKRRAAEFAPEIAARKYLELLEM